jgi:hypothetical protein
MAAGNEHGVSRRFSEVQNAIRNGRINTTTVTDENSKSHTNHGKSNPIQWIVREG